MPGEVIAGEVIVAEEAKGTYAARRIVSSTKLEEAKSVKKSREMFIELSAGIEPSKKAVSFLSRGDVEAVSAVGSLFTPAEVVCGLLNAAVMEAIGRSSATFRISRKAARALYSLLIYFAHKHQFAIPIKMPRCCRNDDKIMALCNLWPFFFLVLLGYNGAT